MSVVQTAFLFPRPTSLQYALRIGFPKLWWVIVSIHWEGSQTRVYFFCSNFEDNKTLFCSTESVKWKLSESLSMMISPVKKQNYPCVIYQWLFYPHIDESRFHIPRNKLMGCFVINGFVYIIGLGSCVVSK